MMRLELTLGLAITVCTMGCGARSGLDPLPRERPTASPSPRPTGETPNPRPTPTGVKPAPVGGSLPFEDAELGDCRLGPPQTTAATCPFVARTLCYADAISACACICPRDQGATICTEGFFPDQTGSIPVSCFLR